MAETMEDTKASLLYLLMACKYSRKKRICEEILQALQRTPTLTPLADLYVTNNGMVQKLVSLKGTIPIKYKDAEYQIPTVIWIPTDYPGSAPIIYVQPTTDPPMRIRPSVYVDRNGEVHLPVVLPIRFSLETLVNFLVTIFQDNPPLYVKKRRCLETKC